MNPNANHHQAAINASLSSLLVTLTQQLKPSAAQHAPRTPQQAAAHPHPRHQYATHATPSQTITHPHITRFFAPLHGKVLVVVDAQNLSYTLRNNHSWDVDYTALMLKIHQACSQYPASVLAHAFVRLKDADDCNYASNYFAGAGYVPHVVQAISNSQGKAQTNADNDILINTVQLLNRHRPDTLVIGSGDGELGCTLADYAKGELPHITIRTLSISGSTSGSLWHTRNRHICANTLVGMDCIRTIQH